MPQQTISQLVNSMRRRCQAVIDAQGHILFIIFSRNSDQNESPSEITTLLLI